MAKVLRMEQRPWLTPVGEIVARFVALEPFQRERVLAEIDAIDRADRAAAKPLPTRHILSPCLAGDREAGEPG